MSSFWNSTDTCDINIKIETLQKATVIHSVKVRGVTLGKQLDQETQVSHMTGMRSSNWAPGALLSIFHVCV